MAQSKYTTQEQIEEMRRELAQKKQPKGGINTPLPKKAFLNIARWLVFSAVVALLLYTLISVQIAKNRGEIPTLLGFNLFSVESGSMEPTLDIGSIILCRKPENAGRLKINDIVTFRTLSGDVVTHRIIEVLDGQSGAVSYRTKGDNPDNSPDQELLTPDRVIAVFVARVPLT